MNWDMVDAYVKLSLYDKKGKAKSLEYRTRCVKDNGFNPVWNEKASFMVDCADFAFLVFEVFDMDLGDATDDVVGVSVVHLSSVQNGFYFLKFLSPPVAILFRPFSADLWINSRVLTV